MRLTYWSTHLKNIYIFFFLQNNACRLENVKLDILLGSLLLYIYAQLHTYFTALYTLAFMMRKVDFDSFFFPCRFKVILHVLLKFDL